MASRFLLFLILATQTLSQGVRIFREIPGDVNQCIRPCLFRPNNANTDVGSALDCGTPYEESCYCATNSDKAKIVSEHIDNCAQASCSAGAESQDASSMRSYYASYCMENGFTADAMTEWYTGTVVEEATRTDKNNMWGWSTATSESRSQVFGDDDKESSSGYLSTADSILWGSFMFVILFHQA
ncbi:hypothetical protein FLONG3_2477 [Fusarium longipes]|uniref:Extracellular membrane protein CFEM domain-containing protein n=1 Tax=Fusarium longipes TaxID=694270 RepID=A0A395T522_9HYPO|nr:hypothetical protein FLONG3_2477 [Fusarium longipes]